MIGMMGMKDKKNLYAEVGGIITANAAAAFDGTRQQVKNLIGQHPMNNDSRTSETSSSLKLTPADVSAIEQREQSVNLRPENSLKEIMDDPTGGEYREWFYVAEERFLVNTFTDVPNLVHDWRVLSQRVQELEKVLEWYANEKNYYGRMDIDGEWQPPKMSLDDGRAAREVLKKK